MMALPLLIAGSGMLCIAAVIAFALTRRYGAGFALMMPLLALLAMTGIMWQAQAATTGEGLRLVLWSLLTSAPVFLGCVIGILLARRRS